MSAYLAAKLKDPKCNKSGCDCFWDALCENNYSYNRNFVILNYFSQNNSFFKLLHPRPLNRAEKTFFEVGDEILSEKWIG